jgi:hypothetical protein
MKGQTQIAATSTASTTPSKTTTSKPVVHTTTTYRAPSTVNYNASPANLDIVVTGAYADRTADRGTVTFNITNKGGRSSGSWAFQAILPRSVGQTSYQSGYQSSIPPGGTSQFTLSFDNAQAGNIVIALYNYGDQKTYYFAY